MSKQRRLAIFLLIIIAFFIFVIATIAFRIYSKTTNNVISFGNIKMQLLQTTLNENNEEINLNNDENINITHNSTISRRLKVKNLGKHEFFLRISLEMTGIDKNNQEFNANNLVTYDINFDDWIYKDGWYYYKNIVKENETTNNLITKINFDINNIISEYPKSKFKFYAKAQAVQAENNAVNVLDVVGWPEG